MAVPRPILLALAGLVLVVGAFLATRSSQEASEPDPAPAAEPAKKGTAEQVAVAQPATPKPKPARPKPAPGMPAPVARAIAQHRTVVIFFHQARGADDAAVAGAVRGLSRFGGRVLVFRAPIKQLSRYKAIVDGVGVSRAPAVVIVDRKGQARLVEGYVDSETLAQEVADTR